METIKREIKAHYKKILILFIISTLKGLLVQTPATVVQLFTWVVLSVLIAMIGGELSNIKSFFDDIINLGNKVKEQRNRELNNNI